MGKNNKRSDLNFMNSFAIAYFNFNIYTFCD